MKAITYIKGLISSAAVIFTVIIIGMYIIGAVFLDSLVPSLSTVLSLLVFSTVCAAVNRFFFSDKLVFMLRLLIHYALLLLTYYIFFVEISGYRAGGGNVAMSLIVFTLIYPVLMGIYAAVRAIFSAGESKNVNTNKTTQKKQVEYKSRFGSDS